MKTAAVIAEFNPFHNGHAFFLNEVRERSQADALVVIMSGDFVQRGEPAVFDKYVRAEAALMCGADLVLELPVRYACADAGGFAGGAVRLLDALGAVDELWFGSESGDIRTFENIAAALSSESDFFKRRLSEGLKEGMPYPKARALAVADSPAHESEFFEGDRKDILSFLESPNNILGIEYCIALKKLSSAIRPLTVKRVGSGHNDEKISGAHASASAIRKLISDGHFADAMPLMPGNAFELFSRYLKDSGPVFADDFSMMLKYKLMSCGIPELTSFSGVSEDLTLRIRNELNAFRSFSQFADLIKARSMTRTHVNRALLRILLDIRRGGRPDAGGCPVNSIASGCPAGSDTAGFAHILAMGNCGKLLSKIKEKGSISLCSTPSVIKDGSYDEDLFASNLYESVRAFKSGTPFVHEFKRRLIVTAPEQP